MAAIIGIYDQYTTCSDPACALSLRIPLLMSINEQINIESRNDFVTSCSEKMRHWNIATIRFFSAESLDSCAPSSIQKLLRYPDKFACLMRVCVYCHGMPAVWQWRMCNDRSLCVSPTWQWPVCVHCDNCNASIVSLLSGDEYKIKSWRFARIFSLIDGVWLKPVLLLIKLIVNKC